MGGLIRFALGQRLVTIIVTVVLIGFGIDAVRNLPIDAFPDISPTQVKIIIKAPGMTPEEVEALITQPVEVELLGIPRQTVLRSISKYALSSITLDFEEGTDIYWARQQVSERLAAVWPALPANVSGGLAPMSTPLGDMFMFTIESDSLTLDEKRFLLDWTLRPALRTVPGVADVNALGGFVRTWEVAPRSQDMALMGVNTQDIISALERNTANDGAGRVDQGEEAILVRVSAAPTSLDDIRQVQVPTAGAGHVNLADVADIRIGALTRYGVVTADGQGEAVQGLIIGLRGANARAVVAGVRDRLAEIEPSLPPNTQINVFYDRSILIGNAVGTVSMALAEAVVLVMILLGLFLGDVRAAITVAAVLPLAALATFLAMNEAAMSANLMSLGGLVIAIGMLVDSSIVVVENIVTRLSKDDAATRSLPKLHLIYRAVKDVSVPVVAGVAIIIVVFLPLLTLEGLEGKLFGPVTQTIVFALVASLALSLTVIPVLASLVLRGTSGQEPWIVRKLENVYTPWLDRALAHPAITTVGAAVLLVSAVAIWPLIGKTFMPQMDEGDIIVQLESIPSINLDTMRRQVLKVEEALLEEVPEIERVVSRSGSDEIGMDPMGLNETDVFLQLRPPAEWTVADKPALEDRIRQVLVQFPGMNHVFTQPIDMRVSEMLTGSRGDVAIKIFGPDLQRLNKLAGDIESVVSGVDGAVDTIASINEGAQYLQVDIDRMLAGRLGLSADAIQARLRAEIEGLQVGTVIDGHARVPLVLNAGLPQGDGESVIGDRLIELPDGGTIPLAEVARVSRVEGPVSVSREGSQRFAVVRTNVAGRDLVGFVDEARREIADRVELPSGYSITWGGEFENQQRAAARLLLVVPVALGLIVLMLFMTFRSLKQTAIILSNIPFALTGGLLALLVTGEYLSVPASVGFIALLGIAVMNGVVMISHFNHLLARGLPIRDVVRDGAVRRLRPVLMTASTCAFGLVPLLLASGPGSEIQKPLAIVVIGGLVSSTVLTLFLLPVVYERFHRQEATS